MADLPDFLKHIMGIFRIIEPVSGTWVNVAQLKPEDVLKHKNHEMKRRRAFSEGKVLYAKLQALQAQMEAEKAEFWDELYKGYNLPSDLQYRIEDGGQVMKLVPAPPPTENPA